MHEGEAIGRAIDHFLTLPGSDDSPGKAAEMFQGALSILSAVYGPGSTQVAPFISAKQEIKYPFSPSGASDILELCTGVLRSLRSEIDLGLVRDIRKEARADVLGDFVLLAREALDEGQKDVAAVLVCAGLEDTLKRYARENGLNVASEPMGRVVEGLRGKNLLSGAQGSIATSLVTLRNRALHAEWSQIDKTAVQSALAFLQEFLLQKFGRRE